MSPIVRLTEMLSEEQLGTCSVKKPESWLGLVPLIEERFACFTVYSFDQSIPHVHTALSAFSSSID
jgi:hypothetical protein